MNFGGKNRKIILPEPPLICNLASEFNGLVDKIDEGLPTAIGSPFLFLFLCYYIDMNKKRKIAAKKKRKADGKTVSLRHR
jgi:hypothetical protein